MLGRKVFFFLFLNPLFRTRFIQFHQKKILEYIRSNKPYIRPSTYMDKIQYWLQMRGVIYAEYHLKDCLQYVLYLHFYPFWYTILIPLRSRTKFSCKKLNCTPWIWKKKPGILTTDWCPKTSVPSQTSQNFQLTGVPPRGVSHLTQKRLYGAVWWSFWFSTRTSANTGTN